MCRKLKKLFQACQVYINTSQNYQFFLPKTINEYKNLLNYNVENSSSFHCEVIKKWQRKAITPGHACISILTEGSK